ncbi:MAG TPA: hypothetical protein VLS89_02355 [Candidatus Nanopelagicales bacterium]|nr:hypothetical protein [Candidatus Nanopelagicales bacterium]
MSATPRPAIERRISVACVLALVALALMAYSLLDPRPPAVIVAMSVGQALGTLSLLFFVVVVLWDLRRSRVLSIGAPPSFRPSGAPPPSGPPAEGTPEQPAP